MIPESDMSIDLGTSGIVFIYFENYESSCDIMQHRLGFPEVFDYGYAKLYKAAENFFVGGVNLSGVTKKTAPEKGATICVTYSSLQRLNSRYDEIFKKVEVLKPIAKSERLPYHSFTVQGPEGYQFEFGTFIDPEQAMILNPVL